MSMERFRAVDFGSVVGAAIIAAGGWRGTIHFARAEMNLSSFKDLSGTIQRTPRSPSTFNQWRNNMTRFKALGAVCLAVALAAASPALAQGGHVGGGHAGGGFQGGSAHVGGFQGGGAHFATGGARSGFAGGGGYRRRGIGPGIAAGLVAGAVLGGGYGYYGDSYAYDNGYDNGYYNNGYYNNGYATTIRTVLSVSLERGSGVRTAAGTFASNPSCEEEALRSGAPFYTHRSRRDNRRSCRRPRRRSARHRP